MRKCLPVLSLLCVLVLICTVHTQAATKLSFWTIWGPATPGHKILTELVERFHESNPDIEVEIYPGLADNQEKLFVSLATGVMPDLVTVDINSMTKLREFLVRLDSLGVYDDFDPDDIYANLIDEFIDPSGSWYLMPLSTSNVALLLNAGLLEASGLPPDNPPGTWDEFVQWACRMTDPTLNQWGAILPTIYKDRPGLLWRWAPFLWQAGGDFFTDDGKPCFHLTPGIEALEFWVDGVHQHQYAPQTGNINGRNMFAAGQVAMNYDTSGTVKFAEDRGVEVRAVPSPMNKSKATNVGGFSLGIFNQANAEASYRFLRWLCSPEINGEILVGVSQLPVRKSVVSSQVYQEYLMTDANMSVFAEQTAYARTVPAMESDLTVLIMDGLREAINGTTGPASALVKAAEQVSAYLGQ